MNEPRIVLVAFPEMEILDVTGPLSAFHAATRYIPGAQYRLEVTSMRGGQIRSSCGLEIATTSIADVRGPIDTIVVVGGDGTRDAFVDHQLLHHVRRLAAGARRVTSVCTGAFLLGATGLLAGRRAATHWAWCALLDEMFPDVAVDNDAIFVRDGNVWTSAGVTSGIDLALALIADDHGHQAASEVARHLVVYLRRSGGQAQYSTILGAQVAEREPIRDLLSWLSDHLTNDLSVAALADQFHLSPREFTRVFKDQVGTTPADHVESVRLEAACRLLETTEASVQQIARTCGFGTPETMHRVFRRRLDTTPGDHRRHFRAAR